MTNPGDLPVYTSLVPHPTQPAHPHQMTPFVTATRLALLMNSRPQQAPTGEDSTENKQMAGRGSRDFLPQTPAGPVSPGAPSESQTCQQLPQPTLKCKNF